jgi:hypothetical protein
MLNRIYSSAIWTPNDATATPRDVALGKTFYAVNNDRLPQTGKVINWATWYNSSWTYRKKITIDQNMIPGSSNLASFPVLINSTFSDLVGKAKTNGDDILFTLADGITKLDHEITSYTSGTGALTTWVEIPSLSATVNTDIFMYYGNASATSQQNITGTWNSSYKGVWHIEDANGSASIKDSTNVNNGIPTGTTSTVGKIGNARIFNGTTDEIKVNQTLSVPITVSGWAKLTNLTKNMNMFINSSPHNVLGISLNRTGIGDTHVYIGNGSGWLAVPTIVSSVNMVHSVWYYVTFTSDGTTSKLYINGVLVGSSIYIPSGWGSMFKLGGCVIACGSSENLNGQLDEVNISNIARTIDWIKTEYANQNSPSTFYNVSAAETY